LLKSIEKEDYQIDVVTEDYVRDYLRIVELGMEKAKGVFKRKRNEILISIEKIVEELKALKKKNHAENILNFSEHGHLKFYYPFCRKGGDLNEIIIG
jgi:hypothetical protein